MAAMGFDASLPQQPQSALSTICALLGWVPMVVALVMLVVVWFHPIEKEMAQMKADREG
jgi:Na+/melibiose symporter-like transporter